MKSPIILRIFKDSRLVEVKQFDLDQVIMGHGGDVQISLPDPTVSPIHCLIELRDSGYYVCDLGSGNGTFKNGRQVLDEAISSGDQIGIGPFLVHFFVGVPKPKAPPIPESVPAPLKVVPKEEQAPKTSPPPQLPEATKTFKATESKSKKVVSHKKNWNTYAPKSEIEDLKSFIQPTKGPVLEVIVAWQERILSTHHFPLKKHVMIGSDSSSDIFISSAFVPTKLLFIDQTAGTRVNLTAGMTAELIQANQKLDADMLVSLGKATKSGSGSMIRLDQNEMLAIKVGDGTVQLFVRHIPATATPALAGLDLTAGEMTGIIVSLVLVSLLALYMAVYGPSQSVEEKVEDQLRLAQFVYDKKEEPPKPPEEKKEVKQTTPQQELKKVELVEKPKDTKGDPQKKSALKDLPAAKAAEVRPMPNNKHRPKKFTSTKQGGSVKLGEKEGANAQSAVDVTKTGLLSAFGSGGNRSQLDKAYSGSGELLGMADKATGTSGQNTNRAGDDLGSKFKDSGAGGKGTATQGIAGVGTKGRSSGQSSYGEVGFGGKGSVAIDAGGSGAEFVGTVDKAAVRRVVLSILNQIRNCYERNLRTNSDLEGKVIIHWEVYDQGRVKTSSVKEAPAELKAVGECVALRIRDQRFPDPPAGSYYEVDYPFMMGKQK